MDKSPHVEWKTNWRARKGRAPGGSTENGGLKFHCQALCPQELGSALEVWVCRRFVWGKWKKHIGPSLLLAARIPHSLTGPTADSFLQKTSTFSQRKQSFGHHQDLSLAFSWPHMDWDIEGTTWAQRSILADCAGSSGVSVWHQTTKCQIPGNDSCVSCWDFPSPDVWVWK